jgi:iron complex outermembrane recepter protein
MFHKLNGRMSTRLLAGAAFVGILAGGPALAQTGAENSEEIVVTGFRASLERALDVKRNAVGSVDAIVAEDIAKFPDQNLAESLQRIPGISIQRDGGEGRAVTVRGLGSQFTRVRVNGLETITTSTDGASPNRDRAFDFNVFASELFSSLVVNKTAEASLDEGSIGAVIDLNTGNALAGKVGLTTAASVQGSYNDLSETWGPRVAGLLAYKAPSGAWGGTLSVAYSNTDTLELGNNTVRWAQATFDSVDGVPCYTQPNSGGTYVSSPGCNAVAQAFHPRIPRYGEVAHDRERLGVTAGFQFRPTDRTEVSIDGLFSRFSAVREEKWGEVLFRSNERRLDVSDYVIDSNNNLISATVDDAWVRMESYLRESETTFYQLSGKVEHDFTDRFRMNAIVGTSKSDADIPVETTIIFDDRDAQDYSYDYSNMQSPVLTFGTDVLMPSTFQLAEIRDRPSNVTNTFETAQLNGEWDMTDAFGVEAGLVYRKFEFDTEAFTRDTAVCGSSGVDRIFGTTTCNSTTYGLPVTASISQLFTLGDAGQPAGTTTQWLVPNLAAAAAYTNLYSRTPALDVGNNRGVVEKVTGGYVQGNFDTAIGGMDLKANLGVRYVKTDQESRGIASGVVAVVERSYDDWLPSANVAIFPIEDVAVRASAAKVMTRPSLGSLTPGGTVDGFNYRITSGNPYLDPFRANSYDLSVEWYFAPESILSVALFAKDVESFPISESRTGTFASTGLPLSSINPSSPAFTNPEGQLWTINSQGNGEGATFEGVEFAIQGPFTFLPGILSNFGGIANATFVDSSADYTVTGPSVLNTTTGALTPQAGLIRNATFFNLSKEAYNATLYYEDDRFSARASVSYRDGFIDATSGTGNIFEGYNETVNVDASARYRINENFEVSLEGINLTDEYRDRFTDLDANRNYEYNHFGRTFLVGLRYKN